MKFSLIFLLFTLVVITQQQRSREMLWHSPYIQQQAAYNNYQLQPYYDHLQEDAPYFRYLRTKTPLIDSYQNGEVSPEIQAIGSPDDASEYTGLEDIKSRTKVLNRYFSDIQQQKARFFFLLNSGTSGGFNNPFLKTATFTLTSTLTLATVQSCIPLNEFSSGLDKVPCRRRKRREISSQYDDSNDQFPIEPSQTHSVTTTMDASITLDKIGWKNYKEILSNEQKVLHGVSSSQEDPVEEDSLDTQLRKKRFVNNNLFVVSSTTTSYLFVPTTITKTVILVSPPVGAAPGVGASSLNCLPASYVVC